MDNFQIYLKKQLLDYALMERKKGVSVDEIKKVLLDAGHQNNIIDEVFLEMEKNAAGKKQIAKDPVEKDFSGMMKKAFGQFMSQANNKEIADAKKDMDTEKTQEVVNEVVEEVEIIEEKNMLESAFFFIYLIGVAAVIFVSAGMTDSEIVKVAISFLPAIISAFASFALLGMAENVPLFMFIPLGLIGIFYAVGRFANLSFFQGLEMEGLSVVNFLVAFVFNIGVVYIKFVKPSHMKRREVKKDNGKMQTPQVNEIIPQEYYAPTPQERDHLRKEPLNEHIKELKKEFNIK